MATQPDEDVANALAAAIGTLTKGTNLFTGKVRAPGANIPDEAVFVLATGGPPTQDYGGQTAAETHFSGVQIRTRSNPNEFEAGQALARLVHRTLHHTPPTGYLEATSASTEPLAIAEDESAHHHWSSNFQLWHDQA
jgi:hypothetical protein